MTREWRPVPGSSDYEVSDDGFVRSWKNGRWGRAAAPRPLKGTVCGSGYVYVSVGGQAHAVHVLVARAFLGEPGPGEEVRHLNGVKTDNRLDNLAWGSRSENALDAVAHGVHPMARRTHCPSGHPYDETNTVTGRRGNGRTFRMCLTCKRAHGRAYWTSRSAS